jgi:phospholipid/cholesterol/gamma-HCH transport system substrate-binding protein
VFIVVVGFGAVELIRGANGDFRGEYHLTGYFPRAGEGLEPGSEVVFRGVQVGRVESVALAADQAKVEVLIEPDFSVPSQTTATIRPLNLFGAEEVSLTSPGNSDAGPYLKNGGMFAHATSADELGDLFQAAAPLLNSINTNDLTTIITELGQSSVGEGPKIQQGITEGMKLAALLRQTTNAQVQALDSFAQFSAALANDGPAINGLSAQENAALPAFNASVADYQKLLANLTPFADQLAQILSDYHPNIATLLTAGDNIARILVAQQNNIGQILTGAYDYAYKLGHATNPTPLPDGSLFGYFNTFVLLSDVNSLVCGLIAPAQSGLSFLAPLLQALSAAGSPLNCSTQMAAFNAAQKLANTTTANSTTANSANSAAQNLTNTVYGILGAPQPQGGTESLGQWLASLLGGGTS